MKEWVTRALVLLVVAAPLAAVLLWQSGSGDDAVDLLALMPESGGWVPGDLTVGAREPLRLRLTSGDVVHGFAIGRDTIPPIDVEPGKVTEVTLTFDRPGTYTYYCTRWCGPNHWRMRGTIEVTGDGAPVAPPTPAPYLGLGLDLDAPHPAKRSPDTRPAAVRGGGLRSRVSDSLRARQILRQYSPSAVWAGYRGDDANRDLSDREIWDLVAYIWRAGTTREALARGARLYRDNCAACHGEAGRGDGVMAGGLADVPPGMTGSNATYGQRSIRPADFTRPDLLGASPVLLHGKIVRGGMGTGMPYWGPIFSDQQLWALVDYLYTYQFDYEGIDP